MCGIFGCVGQGAYNKVIEGLNLLQYRGYDSCGIAYFENVFKFDKTVGTISNLPKVNTNATIAFGHTRWATNGVVNQINAHPHISYDKEIILVHNGIIKNAKELKKQLQNKGVKFYSQTDTEVIANYIAYTLRYTDMNSVLNSLFDVLDGSFSLIVATKKGDLYLIKQFSPLNLLVTAHHTFISSDISSLKTGKLYSLKDKDIVKISKNQITKLNGEEVEYRNHVNDIEKLLLNNHKHYMEKEIYETPQAIYNSYYSIKDSDIFEVLKKYNKVTLIGCGTAYHSCLIGEYLFTHKLNLNASSVLASNYEVNNFVDDDHLHIIVSQSGETADCIRVAESVKEYRGHILVITNEKNSTIAQMSDYCVFTNAEKEIAVASTKTYCCQLFVFAFICHKLKDSNYSINISEFKNTLNEFIHSLNVSKLAQQLKSVDKMILIGKGIDYLTLLEASLKIREIDYVYTIPMYAGELKHGTLSLIDNTSVVLTLNTSHNEQSLNCAINEIQSREGNVIDLTNKKLSTIDEFYKPIFSIIPFQLLSYEIAVQNNRNPDMPRNLAKSVTVE